MHDATVIVLIVYLLWPPPRASGLKSGGRGKMSAKVVLLNQNQFLRRRITVRCFKAVEIYTRREIACVKPDRIDAGRLTFIDERGGFLSEYIVNGQIDVTISG